MRAKYIAENFFEDARQVTGERGMLGFTGTYKGKAVSVQATGMGCPSASIVRRSLYSSGRRTCSGLVPAAGTTRTCGWGT